MRFAIFSALIAVISAQGCANLHAKFYSDAKCTKLDKGLTAKYGTPPKKMLDQMDGHCNKSGGNSMRISCAKAFTNEKWSNAECKGKPGIVEKIPYDTCTPGGPNDSYYVVHMSVHK